MTDLELQKIASEYGTPSFLFDTVVLKNRMKAIKEIVGPKVHLCYSIKANPFLIPTMLECVEKLEVCSPGELTICKELKVPSERIIYSGVNKMRADVEEAIEYEVGVFTAESVLQLKLINQCAGEHKKIVPVILRLNAGSQFGMSKEDVCNLIDHRSRYEWVKIEGIHYFAGTQRKKLNEQKAELTMLKELKQELDSKYCFMLERVEYGPGLPVPYFTTDDFSDTLAPIKEIAADLQAAAQGTELTVEMGRFFASECGYYLTKVKDQKANNGTNYAIVDGGMNHLNYLGQMMGMKVPVMKHFSCGKGELDKDSSGFTVEEDGTADWSLCGSLCTTADVIVRKAPFKNLQMEDTIAFCNIGAYSVTEGIHLFLSRTMPRILLYKGEGEVQIARDFMESSPINCIRE